MGRTGCGKGTYFRQKALQVKGPLNDIESIQKGMQYAEAHRNYPDMSTKELIFKNIEAWENNILEVEANRDGLLACKDYAAKVEEIHNIFPHIPAAWL